MSKKYYDALDNILDRPIAFNPSFKKITGSTNAALLLSQAFYWTKRASLPGGWFWKTRDEWMEETGLTEAELDGAREKCRAVGVIEEKLKGVPATIHYRVVKPKVYELLGFQFPEVPESSKPENTQIPENPESGSYGDFNKETETPSRNTAARGKKFSNPLWDLQHGETPVITEEDEKQLETIAKVEEVATKLEQGLRLNFPRSTKDQQIYKRIAESGNPIDRFIEWVKAEERRLSFAFLYAKDTSALWRDFPQAFPALANEPTEQKGSFYG